VTATNATEFQRRGRAPYRPPVGVPLERREWWGVPLAAIAHLLLLAILFSPVWGRTRHVPMPGAGGPGPSGGGGGVFGARAAASGAPSGERLRYTVMRPVMPSAPRAERVKPPEKQPRPRIEQPRKPVPEQPRERVKPVEVPQTIALAPSSTAAPQIAVVAGGAGDSGSATGVGPGTGGGTGSGVGTGRGSANGPGTGGGAGRIYPATPDFLVMPALPVPSGVRGKTVQLVFKLDERGNILELKFNPTGDARYDRELRARLLEYRFRPAHKLDGTPVPSVYVTELAL
jgi:periplasmic protein TonB